MQWLKKGGILPALAVLLAAPLVAALPVSSAQAQATSEQTTKISLTASTLTHPPIKTQQTYFYPLKEMAALLDLQVYWNQSQGQIEVTGISRAAKFKVGSSATTVAVAGKAHEISFSLGAKTLVRNGITYVPASFFSKVFAVPVKVTSLKNKEISYAYQPRYALASVSNKLFWLNRLDGTIYTAYSGKIPAKAGVIEPTELDWLGITVQQTGNNHYLLQIHNESGEPHINEELYRVMISNDKIIKQSVMSYSLMMLDNYMNEPVKTFNGNVVLTDGHSLELDTPDGKLVQSYDLDKIGGTTEDIYSVEAISPEFMVIRRFTLGYPLLVNRNTQEALDLYDLLFDPETAAGIKAFKPDYWGYRLTYAGRTGSTLHFNWANGKNSQTLDWELNF